MTESSSWELHAAWKGLSPISSAVRPGAQARAAAHGLSHPSLPVTSASGKNLLWRKAWSPQNPYSDRGLRSQPWSEG